MRNLIVESVEKRVRTGRATELPAGFSVGNAQNEDAATGCTVILCEEGAVAGGSITGAAPATRETDLLRSENMVDHIHAVVLSGGSAFGLDAAGGVMRQLEQRGVGLSFEDRVIPIVVGASLFDLNVGNSPGAPDADMGYTAACNVLPVLETGNVGAGTGATVGKMLGMEFAMKGGLGAASIHAGDLVVTAIVAVNAFGCVYDRSSCSTVAGVIDPASLCEGAPRVLDSFIALEMLQITFDAVRGADDGLITEDRPSARTNTTIGCILTNAALDKPQANRVAAMAHDGYARSLVPVHTSFDGDAIFCMACGSARAHPDIVGTYAALVAEYAVLNAMSEARCAYGFPAACDL